MSAVEVLTAICVAPYVGAWIETKVAASATPSAAVAPYVGAWIETEGQNKKEPHSQVAPYVGAWIETFLYLVDFVRK